MNYLQIDKCSLENGLGIRVSLWVSGCSIHCPRCHNPETWHFTAGKPFDQTAKKKLFEFLGKPWVKGLTLTGGHPLEPETVQDIIMLLSEIKMCFPSKDIWLYTGYRLSVEDFCGNMKNDISQLLQMCDVVVDSPYIDNERDMTIAFRGSRNQRIIDVRRTIEKKEIITLDMDNE